MSNNTPKPINGNQEPVEDNDETTIADLTDDLKMAVDQLEASQKEVQKLRKQLEEQPVPSLGLQWLEDNCSHYEIQRDKQSGKIQVSGEIVSEEAGLIETLVVRDFRGKAPYVVHPEDRVKKIRKVSFRYIAQDETLDQAVQGIQITYCPGPQVVDSDECLPLLKNNRPYVLVSDLELEEFRKLPQFGVYRAISWEQGVEHVPLKKG